MAEQELGRLAVRVEGEDWVAYYATRQDSMEDSVHLASIRMVTVVDNPDRKEAFLSLMKDIVSDIIEEAIGRRPSWKDPQPAPEHERSGNA